MRQTIVWVRDFDKSRQHIAHRDIANVGIPLAKAVTHFNISNTAKK